MLVFKLIKNQFSERIQLEDFIHLISIKNSSNSEFEVEIEDYIRYDKIHPIQTGSVRIKKIQKFPIDGHGPLRRKIDMFLDNEWTELL
ncbi:unnamed protein product [Debaryomyces tyrocola]|nr:unnamed protein product [Debaryomyces tyrocola]